MGFCWVTINVSDVEKSLAFYRDAVGLTVKRRMKPSADRELVFLGSSAAGEETEVELLHDAGAEPSFGKDISLGFTVDTLEKTIARLAEHGITAYSGPFQPGPKIRFIFVTDPDGLSIQFVENL
jgi:lactoylglutathione lyase